MASIICEVPIADLGLVWPHVREHIARALKHDPCGGWLPDDVLTCLERDQAKLWVSWDDETKTIEAAMTTELLDYPRARVCRVWLIGGRNMKVWAPLFRDATETWARAAGAKCMLAGGREGWSRVGGYRRTGGMFHKPL